MNAGNDHTCGIRTDGSLACWGVFHVSTPGSFPGNYKDVSGLIATGAVRDTGVLDVWGQESFFLPVPSGAFEQVGLGEEAACARRADQTVICWGNPVRSYSWPPGYKFESLTMGAYFACGLETVGHAAVCWDPRGGADYVTVTTGPFTQVDAGRFFACGLRPDGQVSCFPNAFFAADANTHGQLQVAQGPFREITVGEVNACGLRTNGQAVCWGGDTYGQSTPPVGQAFKHLSAGSTHTCGIRLDGSVTCWGRAAGCDR